MKSLQWQRVGAGTMLLPYFIPRHTAVHKIQMQYNKQKKWLQLDLGIDATRVYESMHNSACDSQKMIRFNKYSLRAEKTRPPVILQKRPDFFHFVSSTSFSSPPLPLISATTSSPPLCAVLCSPTSWFPPSSTSSPLHCATTLLLPLVRRAPASPPLERSNLVVASLFQEGQIKWPRGRIKWPTGQIRWRREAAGVHPQGQPPTGPPTSRSPPVIKSSVFSSLFLFLSFYSLICPCSWAYLLVYLHPLVWEGGRRAPSRSPGASMWRPQDP